MLSPVGEDRRQAVIDGLKAALDDVRLAVSDFAAMTDLMRETVQALIMASDDTSSDDQECVQFLEWLTGDKFVLLGARSYTYPLGPDGGYAVEEPVFQARDSLGVLRDPVRTVLRRASEPAILASDFKPYLQSSALLVVAKSNLQSQVHRRTYMDYVAVTRRRPDGGAIGEVRFGGLFTLDAYEARADETPLIRLKVRSVLRRLGQSPCGHTPAGREIVLRPIHAMNSTRFQSWRSTRQSWEYFTYTTGPGSSCSSDVTPLTALSASSSTCLATVTIHRRCKGPDSASPPLGAAGFQSLIHTFPQTRSPVFTS